MNSLQLFQIKSEIQNAEAKISSLKGQKELLLEELKTKWNCPSVKTAKRLIYKLGRANRKIEHDIQKRCKSLETILNG